MNLALFRWEAWISFWVSANFSVGWVRLVWSYLSHPEPKATELIVHKLLLQETLTKSNEVFATFKKEMEKVCSSLLE